MRELQLLIKPVSSACDLDCRYCFYKDEAKKRRTADYGKMTADVMHAIADKALAAAKTCVFGFQGESRHLQVFLFSGSSPPMWKRRKNPGRRLSLPCRQMEPVWMRNGLHF